jgi:hypothetical protein
VHCQRFFIRRAASGWFRVGSGGETASPRYYSQAILPESSIQMGKRGSFISAESFAAGPSR